LTLALGLLLSAGCDSGARTVSKASPSTSPSTAAAAVPTPASSPTEPNASSSNPCGPIPVEIDFDLERAVPASERTEIRKASFTARKYFRINTTSCAREKVFVYAFAREDPHAVAVTHGKSSIEFFTKTPGWLGASSSTHTVVVLHEWYHVLQARLAWAPSYSTPTWLVEGSAEWSADRAATDLGVYDSFDTPRSEQLAYARYATTLSLGNWKRFVPGAYPLAFAAVDFVVTPKNGRAKLYKFFELVGGGSSWKVAFRQVFGMTVGKFSAAFAAYRERGFTR
jgi:hypothetical protein